MGKTITTLLFALAILSGCKGNSDKDKAANSTAKDSSAYSVINDSSSRASTADHGPEPEYVIVNNDTVYLHPEHAAKFKGDINKWVSDHVVYPKDYKGTERVIVSFIIDKDGKVRDVESVNSKSPALEKEAIRVIKNMPDWTPATNGGENVCYKYTIPIVFKTK